MEFIESEAGGKHYGKVDPFVLTRVMKSSGNAHVDFCRGNIIKYAFRKKGDTAKMIDDLGKAAHYVAEAIDTLKREAAAKNQPELFRGQAPACKDCACQGPCPEICDRLNNGEFPHEAPPWQAGSLCPKCGEPVIDGLPSCTCKAL